MSLTTLAAVKAFKNIEVSTTTHDAEIARLILTVDNFVAEYCGRTFEQNVTTTEYHSTTWGQRTLLLRRPPIASIASLYDDPTRVYAASSLMAATYYVIDDANAGILRLDGASFGQGIQNVKITYSGGFATIPSSLEQAAIELIWLARDKGDQALLGLKGKSIADGSVSYLDNQFPSGVRTTLDLYRFEPVGA